MIKTGKEKKTVKRKIQRWPNVEISRQFKNNCDKYEQIKINKTDRMEFIGKDENNVWRNGEFQERYGNSKKKKIKRNS